MKSGTGKVASMTSHPALQPGRAAVITGASSGIGLAAAQRLAALGMRVCLADIDGAALATAAAALAATAGSAQDILAVQTDVSRFEDLERLRDAAYAKFGEVSFLMNNAGVEGGGALLGERARWRQVLDVNLGGVVNGIQAFLPAMRAQGTDGAIVNTGSKQGITCPPGDTAYNVSKAGIKVVTEALAHDLRNSAGNRITAHLLIPGFTFTGFTRARMPVKPDAVKPDAAWLPEQVIDFLLEKMALGDFYILCPDNSVTRRLDELRIAWAAGDIVHNRPALSRWHPDYQDAFAAYLADDGR
jgi:NAD(P)-dependent dehydrogenase (short-subunit alcohol dehydrogenase family)